MTATEAIKNRLLSFDCIDVAAYSNLVCQLEATSYYAEFVVRSINLLLWPQYSIGTSLQPRLDNSITDIKAELQQYNHDDATLDVSIQHSSVIECARQYLNDKEMVMLTGIVRATPHNPAFRYFIEVLHAWLIGLPAHKLLHLVKKDMLAGTHLSRKQKQVVTNIKDDTNVRVTDVALATIYHTLRDIVNEMNHIGWQHDPEKLLTFCANGKLKHILNQNNHSFKMLYSSYCNALKSDHYHNNTAHSVPTIMLKFSNWHKNWFSQLPTANWLSARNHFKVNYKLRNPCSKKLHSMAAVQHAIPIFAVSVKKLSKNRVLNTAVACRLYPLTHRNDAKHMTIRVAPLIANMTLETWTLATQHLPTNVKDELLSNIKASQTNIVAYTNQVLRSLPIGTPQQRVCVLLLTQFCTSAQLSLDHIIKRNVFYAPLNIVNKRLSNISISLRRYAYLPGFGVVDDQVTQHLAYLELSSGRTMNKSDWQAEIRNRCVQRSHLYQPDLGPCHWSFDDADVKKYRTKDNIIEYQTKLKQAVDSIIKNLLTRKQRVNEGLKQFYERRHEWVTSGSANKTNLSKLVTNMVKHKNLPQVQFDKLDPNVRVNKRVWADLTPFNNIYAAFKAKPRELASASEKFENGKSRALYGVEPVHYILNTYATMGLEGLMSKLDGCEKGSSSYKTYLNEFKRTSITAEKSKECTMFDFADFNRQHTPEAQAYIFDSLAAQGTVLKYHDDWVAANKWIAKAKFNQLFTIPNDNKTYHATQGMFSGTRSTDFINTILNMAYFKVASDYVAQQYGVFPESLYHVHQGDDVWISNTNKVWARLVYYTMNQQGLVFQEKKQMFGPARGEYLRLLYTNGTTRGYLQRSLINYTLRPVQNDFVMDIKALAGMFAMSFETLSQRGLNKLGLTTLWVDAIRHWLVVRSNSGSNSIGKPVRIPTEIITNDSMLGGFALPPPGYSPTTLIPKNSTLPGFPAVVTNTLNDLKKLPSAMIDDWIRSISVKSHAISNGRDIDVAHLKDIALQTNYETIIRNELHTEAFLNYKDRVLKHVQQWMSCVDTSKNKMLPMTNAQQAFEVMFDKLQQAGGGFYAVTPSAMSMQMAAFVPNQLQSQHAPSKEPVSFIGNSISRFEAQSVYKSVDMAASALRTSKREALRMMASVNTTTSIAGDEVAKLLTTRSTSSSDAAFEYLMGRQVGSVAYLSNIIPPSLRDVLHAANSHNLIKCDALAVTANNSDIYIADILSTMSLIVSMRQQLVLARKVMF